jgi:hypothetical protein
MRLVEFRPMRRNSLLGFATVELPIGLIIADVVVGASHGRVWALLPTKPMVGPDGAAIRDDAGKIKYAPVLRWHDDELHKRWSDAVVALVRAEYPDALDEAAP